MMKRKLTYAGHALKGSVGLSHLQMLEGQGKGRRKQGRPRGTWIQNMLKWAGRKTYGELKIEIDGSLWLLTFGSKMTNE